MELSCKNYCGEISSVEFDLCTGSVQISIAAKTFMEIEMDFVRSFRFICSIKIIIISQNQSPGETQLWIHQKILKIINSHTKFLIPLSTCTCLSLPFLKSILLFLIDTNLFELLGMKAT